MRASPAPAASSPIEPNEVPAVAAMPSRRPPPRLTSQHLIRRLPPPPPLQVRITASGKMRGYLTYAVSLIQARGGGGGTRFDAMRGEMV